MLHDIPLTAVMSLQTQTHHLILTCVLNCQYCCNTSFEPSDSNELRWCKSCFFAPCCVAF
eukprot:m.62249 g.62249  ORF g.62249 m.62249 type:complete len:60 (+) comp11901_c0_seq1:125-304(+)